MRLDKYLSHMGFGTRNDVKKLIKNGWVTINDETIKKADYNVKENDRVCVDDEPVSYVEYEYYILIFSGGYYPPLHAQDNTIDIGTTHRSFPTGFLQFCANNDKRH